MKIPGICDELLEQAAERMRRRTLEYLDLVPDEPDGGDLLPGSGLPPPLANAAKSCRCTVCVDDNFQTLDQINHRTTRPASRRRAGSR